MEARSRLVRVAVFAATATAFACTSLDDPAAVESVIIRPRDFATLIGTEGQLRAYARHRSGSEEVITGDDVTFSSRRPDIVSTTSEGRVAAVGNGSAWILLSASVGGRIYTDSVVVTTLTFGSQP